jgi:hypothetical protein
MPRLLEIIVPLVWFIASPSYVFKLLAVHLRPRMRDLIYATKYVIIL